MDGKTLVKSITDDMAARGLEPDCQEQQSLRIAANLQDKIVALNAAIDRDGVTQQLKSGRIVANPAVAEVRQYSLALAKVLDSISMDEAPPINAKKQAAAQARWRAHNEAKAARARAGAE
jgi:hypothetical protein